MSAHTGAYTGFQKGVGRDFEFCCGPFQGILVYKLDAFRVSGLMGVKRAKRGRLSSLFAIEAIHITYTYVHFFTYILMYIRLPTGCQCVINYTETKFIC